MGTVICLRCQPPRFTFWPDVGVSGTALSETKNDKTTLIFAATGCEGQGPVHYNHSEWKGQSSIQMNQKRA